MTEDTGVPDGRSDEGGRVVPAYALTRGRTRSVGTDLPLETRVAATEVAATRAFSLRPERRAIIELCQLPVSVAEVAARLELPVGVARVLVSDLASIGLLTVHLPAATPAERPSRTGGSGPA